MFSRDRIISLDIGTSKVVMAEFIAMRGGGLELLNYGMAPIGLDPDSTAESSAYIVTGIRDLMREKMIKPGKVYLTISGQNVIPKNVSLPPVAKDKIGQVIQFEAQNSVPFPLEEVVWDYILVKDDTGQQNVMIVAVKEELVARITACVMAAGLDPEVVDVSPLALYNTVRYNYTDLPGCTMILDMGARSTDVVFIEGSRISTRSIPVAGNVITRELMKEFDLSFENAEKLKLAHGFVGFGGTFEAGDSGVAARTSKVVRNVMTRLHAEVSRTINFYRSQQGGSQPALVLLAGGTSMIQHANTFLREKLKVEVDYLNPFRTVAVSEAISTESVGKDMHLMGQVVGVALRRIHTCPSEINLMPRELVKQKTFDKRLPFFALAALGLVLIMVVWWIYFQRVRTTSVGRLEEVSGRVALLAQNDQTIAQIRASQKVECDKAASLVDIVRQRTQWIDILEAIHSQELNGMWLTSLRVLNRGEGAAVARCLEIKGMAFIDKVKIEGISNDFAASLKGKSCFTDDVQVKKVKPVQGTDYLIEFVIEVVLK